MDEEPKLYDLIYDIVRQVPLGKVATYGQVARIAGRCSAQMVGFAMSALRSRPDEAEVPWQRVINSAGRISISRADLSADLQRALLEEEGIEFDARGYVDWRRFGWAGLDWSEVEALWGSTVVRE